MKVHYLQHVPFEGLGYIESWLKENQHPISATRFHEPDHQLPHPDDIDALIIMGGPMGVYDEALYPWLKPEKAFISDCIARQKKVLGICLGAQLIATCLGSDIHTAPHKEIGWFPVQANNNPDKTYWFTDLFKDNPVVFHWHGDQFRIPEGCANLLNTGANTNQAFIYKEKVIAIQFHLEVERVNVLQMLDNCGSDLNSSQYVQGIEQLVDGTKYCVSANQILRRLLSMLLNN